MADLSKIKGGDTLKIPVTVTHADDARGAPVRVAAEITMAKTRPGEDEEFWISREMVEAAEHIPAPKVWIATTRVKHVREIDCGVQEKTCCGYCPPEKGERRGGIVCKQTGEIVVVYWPESGLESMWSDELELDEGPL